MQIERLLLPGRRWAHSHVLAASAEFARSNAVQDHIIIIPGNPGVASFYLPFAERLHAALGGRCSVRALNLAGFVPGQSTRTVHQCNGHEHVHEIPAPLYSLADQCEFLTLSLTALHLQLLAADESSEGDAGNPIDPRVPPAPVVRGILSPIIVASALPGASSTPSGASAAASPASPSSAAPALWPRRQHRLILVAHSIGADMALAAMRRARLDQAAWNKRNGAAASASALNTAASSAASSPALAALGAWLVTSPGACDWSTPPLPRTVPAMCITHSFLVAPFVRMDLSWIEFRLTRWFLRQWRWLPPILSALLRLLPFPLFRLLLRVFSGIKMAAAVQAVWDTFSCSELMSQFAFLGHTEFQFVLPSAAAAGTGAKTGTVFDASILAESRAQLSLLYAGRGRDIWGPSQQMFDFQALVPALRAKQLQGVSHAWCAFDEEVEIVVQEVTKQLEEMQQEARGVVAAPSKALTVAAPAPAQLMSNQLIASRL